MIDQQPPAVADEGRLRADVRPAVMIAGALAVIGVLLGLVWAAWSPQGGLGLVRAPGAIQPDETENWVAADGRFLVLTGAVGILAGLLAWTRVRSRGPLVLAALAGGGLIGALLTELVGHVAKGGMSDGATNTVIRQLPLSVHMPGLRLLEAGLAVLVYGVLVAFTSQDDLGRADPVRDDLLREQAAAQHPGEQGQPGYPPQSVGPVPHPQHGGTDGDAPGVLQQRDLPPQ